MLLVKLTVSVLRSNVVGDFDSQCPEKYVGDIDSQCLKK